MYLRYFQIQTDVTEMEICIIFNWRSLVDPNILVLVLQSYARNIQPTLVKLAHGQFQSIWIKLYKDVFILSESYAGLPMNILPHFCDCFLPKSVFSEDYRKLCLGYATFPQQDFLDFWTFFSIFLKITTLVCGIWINWWVFSEEIF